MASIHVLPSMCATAVIFILSVKGQGIVNNYGGAGTSMTTIWPNSTIYYKYTAGVGGSANDLTKIRTAMTQMKTDTGGCINFQPAPTNYVGPFLNIKPRADPAVPEAICRAHQGFLPNGQQNSGQLVVMFGGSIGGCLDDPRDTMRILANLVGLRNEWMTAKRSSNMYFPNDRNSRVAQTLQSFNLYDDSKIPPATDYTDTNGGSDLDVTSITMVGPTRYAADPNRPIFNLDEKLEPVGNKARLSAIDCATIQQSYLSFCPAPTACPDPYNPTVSFYPSAELQRNIQCQSPSGGAQILGELFIDGIPYAGVGANAAITGVTIVPTVPGIKATLMTRQSPLAFPLAACVAAGPCIYSVQFSMTAKPSLTAAAGAAPGGVKNLQVNVNLNKGSTLVETLTVTINLNCAPIFQVVKANNFGPSATMAAVKEFRYPDEIQDVVNPGQRDAVALLGSSAGQLAQFIVNYNTPDGIGDIENQGAASAGNLHGLANKVFVNCAVAGGANYLGASTVIGSVQATDPEGDPVTYFAYSGDTRQLPTATNPNMPAMTFGGEQHTITKDGVIIIAALTNPNELATAVTDPQGNPGVNPGNPGAGLPAGTLPLATVITKDIFIVAVDSNGGSSILQTRWRLACGPAI